MIDDLLNRIQTESRTGSDSESEGTEEQCQCQERNYQASNRLLFTVDRLNTLIASFISISSLMPTSNA